MENKRIHVLKAENNISIAEAKSIIRNERNREEIGYNWNGRWPTIEESTISNEDYKRTENTERTCSNGGTERDSESDKQMRERDAVII